MRGPARQAVLDLVNEAHADGRLCIAHTHAQAQQLSQGVRCGLIVRPFRGVYALGSYWDDLKPEERILCAARTLREKHPGWIYAGTTAAVAHGLRVSWRHLSALCVATDRKAQTHGFGNIRRIAVSEDRTAERAGLHVTSFARTVCDCLRMMPFGDALALADSALRIRGLTSERLQLNISRICQHVPGVNRVQEIVSLADGRSESGGESIARAQMIALGFAAPDLQREIDDPLTWGKGFRADYAWDLPDGSVVLGELDGREKYQNVEMTDGHDIEDVLLAERRREARMTLSDSAVRVVRFSLAEAMDARGFERLLLAYGVPRVIAVPEVATAEPTSVWR